MVPCNILVRRCRPKMLCLYLCASYLILLSTPIFRNVIGMVRNICSVTDTGKQIERVCKMYYDGTVSGELCSSLCDKDHFQYTDCGNNILSAKSVLIMDCNGCELGQGVQKVVIKIGTNMVKWENITKTILQESDSLDTAAVKARKIVEEEFVSNFGQYRFTNRDVIAMVLGKNVSDYVNDISRRNSNYRYTTAIRTLLSLALQNEYTKLVGLKDYAFVPKLYGFCGPAFFMEYTPPLSVLGYILPFQVIGKELYQYRFNMKPWSERARLALDLLHATKAIEHTADGVVEICDLQPKNTGINAHDEVVEFDLDHIVYKMQTANMNCAEDEDCHILSCQGHCNTTIGKCSELRVNNNLQAICQNLFQGRYPMSGILRFPPWAVRTELYEALENCINPKAYYKNALTNKAGEDIAERLEHVLRKSLQ